MSQGGNMEVKQLIKEIKENLEKTANIKSIFGDVMKVDDLSIIPVGSIKMKGGGGGGIGSAGPKIELKKDEDSDEETATGKGGGLGMTIDVTPVGYIKIKEGNAEYIDIVDKTKVILNALKIIFVMVIFSGLKNLFKRKKK